MQRHCSTFRDKIINTTDNGFNLFSKIVAIFFKIDESLVKLVESSWISSYTHKN